MFKVEIPVYYHTKETLSKEDMGISVDDNEMRVGLMTFYNIDVVEQAVDEDTLKPVAHAAVLAGGKFFTSPLSKEEVEELIEKAHGNNSEE